MSTRVSNYRQGVGPLPPTNRAWQLYGAGLQNLGQKGVLCEQPLPAYGPDELVVRIDAVGLCFSDIKIIQMGSQHPRLTGRDLAAQPLTPGHEVSLTVVGVGENLDSKYRVGQRFAVQPDVWYRGESMPYGYTLAGGYQEYGLIGPQILQGDAGSYLIPVPDDMTYAGAALTEPWACVEASYRVSYRTRLKTNGVAWFLGSSSSRMGYVIDKVWALDHRPAKVILTGVPDDLSARIRSLCQATGSELSESGFDQLVASGMQFDDIFVLDGDANQVDQAAGLLARGGILAMARPTPMSRPVRMDLGRLHYDHIVYVGTTGLDLDAAYQQTPVRTSLMPQGTAWVIGAGGPMGRMHVQRALESAPGPHHILATEVSPERVQDLADTFAATAKQRGLEFTVLNVDSNNPAYRTTMDQIMAHGGIHDVEVMAAIPSVVVDSVAYLAPGGVVNLFAGLKRGATAPIEAWLIYGPQQIRLVGHSGSALADQIAIVERAAGGQLAPERSMVALAGLKQLPQGLQALIDAVYPGKIVIFPTVVDFPLTPLPDLKHTLPQVYDRLDDGRSWTAEAEEAFLELMLPE